MIIIEFNFGRVEGVLEIMFLVFINFGLDFGRKIFSFFVLGKVCVR